MRYTVVLEPDEGGEGYTVRVPALPGCVTEGSTRQEAIVGFIEGLKKAASPFPRRTNLWSWRR